MSLRTIIQTAAVSALIAAPATAETLRIQTHYAPETISGQQIQAFIDDIHVMSGGDLQIEMFFSSSVVKSVETFDAAASGILDCDMTGGAYQTGKNPAFQFVGDIMGGYDTPWQQYSWLYHGGGFDAADALYGQYNMKLIGWWINGQESMSSSKPITGPEDLKAAIVEGAVDRVRPKIMTVATTLIGLLPVMYGAETGAQVMKRIAAPMVGGLISSTVLTLVIIPVVYDIWKRWELRRAYPEKHQND